MTCLGWHITVTVEVPGAGTPLHGSSLWNNGIAQFFQLAVAME